MLESASSLTAYGIADYPHLSRNSEAIYVSPDITEATVNIPTKYCQVFVLFKILSDFVTAAN